MQDEGRGSAKRTDELLLEGLTRPTQDLLLQLLLYKTIFMGAPFRSLAAREDPPELRDLLMRLHAESIGEAAALTVAMREWDQHPAAGTGIHEFAEEVRRRFIVDIIALKESVVDLGLGAAMRAPTQPLRQRFLALTDVDRAHADALREHIGVRTTAQHVARPAAKDAKGGVADGRAPGETLRATVRRALDELHRQGASPHILVVSPDALRHLRDEHIVDETNGRAFGLQVEIDMGWRGDSFAIETVERIGFAELLTAAKAARGEQQDPSGRPPER